jgi:hypothetical protein
VVQRCFEDFGVNEELYFIRDTAMILNLQDCLHAEYELLVTEASTAINSRQGVAHYLTYYCDAAVLPSAGRLLHH